MGEFADVALEIASEFDGDLAEQVTGFVYRTVSGADYAYRGIASDVKSFEADGVSVHMTSSKWFTLKHELPVEPQIDDMLIISGRKHYIGRVIPVDNVVGWYLFTNA